MEIYLFFSFILFLLLIALIGKKINEPLLFVIAGFGLLLPILDLITGGYQIAYTVKTLSDTTYDGSNLVNASFITSQYLVTTKNTFTFSLGMLLIGVMVILLFYGLKPSGHNPEGGG